MRIAWFHPFAEDAPEAALIARVTAAFATQGHQAVIFRLGAGGDRSASTELTAVRGWRDRPGADDAPLSFHSFGNGASSFALAHELLARRPGVAILHDQHLGSEPGTLAAPPEALIARLGLGAAAATEVQQARLAQDCPGPVVLLPPPQSHDAVEAYAASLLSLGQAALGSAPLTGAASILGRRLADMHVLAGDALVGRVARAAAELFPVSAPVRS